MRFGNLAFGSIEVDGKTYGHDLVVDRGRIRKRRKAPSKPYRQRFGHTPLSVAEDIPWRCRRLVVGSGIDGAPRDGRGDGGGRAPGRHASGPSHA
jgi:hypothetical protein